MKPGRQTQLKRERERAVRERRALKQAKKHAKSAARRAEAQEAQEPTISSPETLL